MLKPVSDKRSEQNREYHKARVKYLKGNRRCQACQKFGRPPAPATEIHHKRGRIGRLLPDIRFFCAVCRRCHEEIHRNPRIARELGLLASRNEMDVYPTEQE